MRHNNRGDTIVEVMLSAVILSIVLAGSYALSSRATRLNQSSYERTRATQLVQEQAELIRTVYTENSADWQTISSVLGSESFYNCRDKQTAIPPQVGVPETNGIFYLESSATGPILHTGTYMTSSGPYYSWAARSTNNSNYDDFIIYTCWDGLSKIGHEAAGAVIRLGDR